VPDPSDMESPVTRRELREELQGFATKRDLEAFATKRDLEAFATKRDLEGWAHQLDRMWDAKLAVILDTRFESFRRTLEADFARYAKVFLEEMRSFVRTMLEPHQDVPARVTTLEELPPRVAKLEAKVFAPRRKRR
jgi:hypothetical protein